MSLAKIWRNTSVRAGILFTGFFLAILLLTGVVTYISIQDELQARLDIRVIEHFVELEREFNDDGLDGLIAEIQEEMAISSKGTNELVFVLHSKDGKLIVGKGDILPLPVGLQTVELNDGGSEHRRYRIKSGEIGGMPTAVGMNLKSVDEIREVLLANLLIAAITIILLSVVSTFLLARRIQSRFNSLQSSLYQVSRGNWDMRLPISSANDDLDTFATSINETLARLQHLMEAIRQVSVDIAHDLKTPLGRLYIATEEALILTGKGENPDLLLEEINCEAKAINSTFEALLSISQIEGGASKDRFRPVDLTELVDVIIEAYKPVAEEYQDQLTKVIEASGPFIVNGDWDLLNRLVANLIENALRHCPPRTHIEISLSNFGPGVALSVSDTGPGIPDDEREKVLRRLYRLEKSRTTPGSGLGLSLVKAISDLHKAKLSLSDNHPGLMVTIVLPKIANIK